MFDPYIQYKFASSTFSVLALQPMNGPSPNWKTEVSRRLKFCRVGLSAPTPLPKPWRTVDLKDLLPLLKLSSREELALG